MGADSRSTWPSSRRRASFIWTASSGCNERNLAGLTPDEQVAMNTAGCMLLREMFALTRSSLDTDRLAINLPQ